MSQQSRLAIFGAVASVAALFYCNDKEEWNMSDNPNNTTSQFNSSPQPQYVYVTQGPQQPKKSIGLAVASMVLGIVSVVFCCCFVYISIPCGIVGLILGAISVATKKGGKGMAIAGIVCSIVSLAVAIIAAAAGASLYYDMMNSYNRALRDLM